MKKKVGWILVLTFLVPLTGCLRPDQNFAKKNLKSWELHGKAARAHYETLSNEDTKRIRIQSLDESIATARKAVKK